MKTPVLAGLAVLVLAGPGWCRGYRPESNMEQADDTRSLRDLQNVGYLGLQARIDIPANTDRISFQAPASGGGDGPHVAGYYYTDQRTNPQYSVDDARDHCFFDLKKDRPDVNTPTFLESGRVLSIEKVSVNPTASDEVGGAYLWVKNDAAVAAIGCYAPTRSNYTAGAFTVGMLMRHLGQKGGRPVADAMVPSPFEAPLAPPKGQAVARDNSLDYRDAHDDTAVKDLENAGVIMLGAKIDIPAHANTLLLNRSKNCPQCADGGANVAGYEWDDKRTVARLEAPSGDPDCQLILRDKKELSRDYSYFLSEGRLLSIGAVTVNPLNKTNGSGVSGHFYIEIVNDGAVKYLHCTVPDSQSIWDLKVGLLKTYLGTKGGAPVFAFSIPQPRAAARRVK